MRKVIVFKIEGYGSDKKRVQHYTGMWHQWATEFEEFADGAVEVTVGIIEKDDGTVCTAMPSMIQFADKGAV